MKSLRVTMYRFIIILLCLFAAQCQKSQGTQNSNSNNDVTVAANRFTAFTNDGKKFDTDDYPDRKILFAFFTLTNRATYPTLDLLQRKLIPYESEKNFKVIGVSLDYDKTVQVTEFIKNHNFTFPVIMDNAGLELATRMQVEHEVSLVFLDGNHQPVKGMPIQDVSTEEAKDEIASMLRQEYKIETFHSTAPHLGITPNAPNFTVEDSNGQKHTLADYRGKALYLMFFLPTCPHCQQELGILRDKLYPELHKDGLEVLAISTHQLDDETKKLLGTMHYPWPVVDGSDMIVKRLYTSEFTVPVAFLIDKEGKIRFASRGFPEEKAAVFKDLAESAIHSQNLMTMWFKHVLDLPNPPLLSDKHFNGSASCMVCHEAQGASWEATPHAHAWETLEVKGKETDTECVGCHSIGKDSPLGWQSITNTKTQQKVAIVPPLFQNVQCEHCHGLGGPHITQKPITEEDLKKTCLECHTDKFSLHFDYNERISKVNHSDTNELLKMTEDDRIALLKKVSKTPNELFGTQAHYVGNTACMSCHADIHKAWTGSVHAKAFETLKKVNKDTEKSCLACHTVGYDQKGGYQESMHKDLEGVGCESCHGPGSNHVVSKSKRDIRGLGDDCPFCVIEQICSSCHNAKNDPDFNVKQALQKIKGHH